MNALLNAIADTVDCTGAQTRNNYWNELYQYAGRHETSCEKQILASGCDTAAKETLDALESRWKRLSFFTRSGEMENDRMRVVMFLIPMLLRSDRPECKAFAEMFRDGWGLRFPKRAFRILSAEEIAAGFRKRPLDIDWKHILGGTRE